MRLRLLAPVGAVLAVLALAAPALASEQIRSFDAHVSILEDGTIDVTETIVYDFGSAQRHGIYRDLITKQAFDTTFDRLYPLNVLSVEVTDGSSRYDVSHEEGGVTRIKIGDPDATITGAHTYTIRYTMEGTLNGFGDHDELYWNITGLDWTVGMERVMVSVQAPGAVTMVDCFAGPQDSVLPCRRAEARSTSATFDHRGLFAYEGVTIVVGLPKGLVSPAPQPILEERLTLASAFKATPVTTSVALALFVLSMTAIGGTLWTRGRDRRFRGSQTAQVMGGEEGDEAVPLLDADTSAPVEFAPPEGIRPGQVGTLMDEKANTLDVTATIIDLAVRGHLMIREIPKEGWFGKPDWELIQLDSSDPLVHYEERLLEGLFRDGREVTLSSLRTTFVTRLRKVEDSLYADARRKGWFRNSPKKVREKWSRIGLLVAIGGAGLTWLAATQRLGLAALPIPLAGILTMSVSSRMPARTAKGTAMLRRVRGFRTVIEKAETHMSRWAEEENVFTKYLPYAIVFGCTEKWAKAFESLGQEPETNWYVSTGQFRYLRFAASMEAFTVTTGGTISSTPGGSGGSGFGGGGSSGGGGGGGGGGSW